MSAERWESVARIAMLVAAAVLFVATCKARPAHRSPGGPMSASKDVIRFRDFTDPDHGVAMLVAKRARLQRNNRRWQAMIASAHNARTPKGRAVTRDPLRRLHVPRG